MGKKKANKPNSTRENPLGNQESREQKVPEVSAPVADPVSQLKMSLAALTKHVEAIGAVLGVRSQEKPFSPQDSASASQSTLERPDMTADEKKEQRKAKAAEKKARAEIAIAKKQAEATGVCTSTEQSSNLDKSAEVNQFARPDMSQEEKKRQRAEKAAAKKARADASVQKKQVADGQQPSTATENEELSNGYTDSHDKESSPFQSGQPLSNSPSKSALKKPKDFEDDRKVNFDFAGPADSDDENIPSPAEELYIPSPRYIHNPDIHHAFYNLCVKCEKQLIYEIDDLCTEFILAFRSFFRDFLGITVEQEEEDEPENLPKVKLEELGLFGIEVNKALSTQIAFLNCDGQFPLPSALGNIVKQLKREINKLDTKAHAPRVHKWVQKISHMYFEGAYDFMANHLKVKLKKAKHLILYNCNRVMEKILLRCKDENLTCCVIDDRANGSGYTFAQWLCGNGFNTEYAVIDGAAGIVHKGSLFLMGCSSVLSNGNITGINGTSQLCMLSQFYNVPTVCLAQSFKFVDKATLQHKRMALLYRERDEVIPSDLITAIATDIRILPPSSAPAVLKAKALDSLNDIA